MDCGTILCEPNEGKIELLITIKSWKLEYFVCILRHQERLKFDQTLESTINSQFQYCIRSVKHMCLKRRQFWFRLTSSLILFVNGLSYKKENDWN